MGNLASASLADGISPTEQHTYVSAVFGGMHLTLRLLPLLCLNILPGQEIGRSEALLPESVWAVGTSAGSLLGVPNVSISHVAKGQGTLWFAASPRGTSGQALAIQTDLAGSVKDSFVLDAQHLFDFAAGGAGRVALLYQAGSRGSDLAVRDANQKVQVAPGSEDRFLRRVAFVDDTVCGQTADGVIGCIQDNSFVDLGATSEGLSRYVIFLGGASTFLVLVDQEHGVARWSNRQTNTVRDILLGGSDMDKARRKVLSVNRRAAEQNRRYTEVCIAAADMDVKGTLYVVLTGHPIAEGVPVISYNAEGSVLQSFRLKTPTLSNGRIFGPEYLRVVDDHVVVGDGHGNVALYSIRK